MTRSTWDQHWIKMAWHVAERSTCKRRAVGAVAVRNNLVLSTGYNGSPAGLPHCTDVGCLIGVDKRCKRSVHAETNVILAAARHGVSLEGATLYCTTKPCEACSVMILNSGIDTVVYDEDYVIHGTVSAGVSGMIADSHVMFMRAGDLEG